MKRVKIFLLVFGFSVTICLGNNSESIETERYNTTLCFVYTNGVQTGVGAKCENPAVDGPCTRRSDCGDIQPLPNG